MLLLQIFLSLLWASAIIGALVIGVLAIIEHARWTDRRDVPALSALAGLGFRVVILCAVLTVLIGVPAALMGWA